MKSTRYVDKKYFVNNNHSMQPIFGMGDVVRKLRKTKAKMGIVAFARHCGVNKATISKIEKGGKYTGDTIAKIAAGFGVSEADLYAYISPAPASLPDDIGYCSSPTHARYHEMLKDILHGTRKDAHVWIHGIASNLVAMSRAAKAPERQSDDLAPGAKVDDIVMFDLTTEFSDASPSGLTVKISEHDRKLRKRNK